MSTKLDIRNYYAKYLSRKKEFVSRQRGHLAGGGILNI